MIQVKIDIDELAGYQLLVDGEVKQWGDLTRRQQILVLNSFSQGYKLFEKFLKDE